MRVGEKKKSVGHKSTDEVEQSLKRKSEDRISVEAKKRKKDMDNEGGREKKSVGHESSNEAEQSLKRKSETRSQRIIEDDAFIDDARVDPHGRIITADDFIHNAPQVEEGEEDDEIDNLIKSKKMKKKGFVCSPQETAMLIEQFLAKFEVAAEEDIDLRNSLMVTNLPVNIEQFVRRNYLRKVELERYNFVSSRLPRSNQ
ncbi:hypothetical protein SUGI_0009970 [Cryptomeria japonica]|nr:hypothetical protein SUGI_0009970 [Cryptomeria japonica]